MAITLHKLSDSLCLFSDDAVCKALNITPTHDWFSVDYWQQKAAVTDQAEGRGTTLFVQHENVELVLRHYKRGGWVRHVTEDWFYFSDWKNTRPYQELDLLSTLHNLHLPVPTGIAGLVQRIGLGYRADIISKRIDSAKDVHAFLLKGPLDRRVWFDIGRAVKAIHDHQVYHHDLNIKNIMLDAQQKVWIIDFDKCSQKSGHGWKKDNINRLHRSLHKQQKKHLQYAFNEQDWAHLLEGYA